MPLQQNIPFHATSASLWNSRNKAATTYLTRNQPLGFKDFVSGGYGGSVQSKYASQFASGRQALPSGQPPGADLLRNLFIQLAI